MSFALSDDIIVEFAILCEDIREEVGRKLSLMGVFTGDVLVAELPAQIRSAFCLTFRSKSEGKYEVKIRLNLDDAKAVEGVSQLEFRASDRTGNVVIPLGMIRVEKACDLILQCSVREDHWVEVLRKRISQSDMQP